MASNSHPTPLLDDEDLDDDESQPEDDDANSASTSSSLPTAARPTASSSSHFVTVALPPAPQNGIDHRLPSATVIVATPERQIIALPAPGDKKPPMEDSRKLFQRLWTDEDEIELLRGFLDYTAQRRGGLHQDTAVFYDQIKCKLQLEFNKNQLIEKLRRLKKKYRTVVSKMSAGKDVCFKSAHDRTTFEISSKIWSHIAPRGGGNDDNMDEDDDNNANHNHNTVSHHFASAKTPKPNLNLNPSSHNFDPRGEDASLHSSRKRHRLSSQPSNAESNANVAGLIEDAVRNCISPMLKEILSSPCGGGSVKGSGSAAYSPLPFGPFGSGGSSILDFGLGIGGDLMDERWKKQQILELEVYSKRIDLMQDQIRAKLEELRSIRR